MPATSPLGRRNMQTAIWSIVAVFIVIAVLVIARLASNTTPAADNFGTASAVPASLLKTVTSVPSTVLTTVGVGTAASLPIPVTAPALTESGKPRILYVGGEFCPFCAAERWPMVMALSRFGSFSNLKMTQSASADVYPNTQTFSFHGATYSSQYLAFDGVEIKSNQPQGSDYAPLDTLSSSDQTLVDKYDAAPYLPSGSAGSIPFIDFGGQYLISGASYDPGLLQGKSAQDIANALSEPTNPISKAVVGTANTITATICSLTGNQPATVCSAPEVKDIQSKLMNK